MLRNLYPITAINGINKHTLIKWKDKNIYNLWHCRSVHKSVIQLNQHNNDHSVKGNIGYATSKRHTIQTGPSLKDFLGSSRSSNSNSFYTPEVENVPYLENVQGNNQKVYINIYGCQMNTNDAEIIWSILKSNGYLKTDNLNEADIVLLITCAIRDNAEQKIWNKLDYLNGIKNKKKKYLKQHMKIGLLGCMAERLKNNILERGKIVDVIAGPDSYKDLPRLLASPNNETAINVILSFDETYADVTPVKLNQDSISAFVSIMRGCDNMCTYCIVPFTRGRERSRPISSIIDEVQHLSEQGVKEITLLGQNVNSYRDLSESRVYVNSNDSKETELTKGFKTVYKPKKGGFRFADLLDKVSLINPDMRIRFTSPHPKDFPDEILHLIAERPNVCKQIHLPAQSGNSLVLERMRRGYTRDAYLDLVNHIRNIIPNVHLSSDFIVGFCGETEQEFEDTLTLVQAVKYNMAYLFSYSMREKTTAHRRFKDDVDQHVKIDRLKRLINLYRTEVEKLNQLKIGSQQLVLVETTSKRSDKYFQGRTDGNVRVLVPSLAIPENEVSSTKKSITAGDYIVAQIYSANSHSLMATPLYHSSIIKYSASTI